MCHAIFRYAKANNKYIKDYNKDEEESFLQYNDADNLYTFFFLYKKHLYKKHEDEIW